MPFGDGEAELYLSLYGTGFRGNSGTSVRIAGVAVPVLAAVPHSQFPGLDQAVLGPIPRTLMNRGEVGLEFKADDVPSNFVTVSFREEPTPDSRIVFDITANPNSGERLVIWRNTLQWIRPDSLPAPSPESGTLNNHISTTLDDRPGISGSWQPRWPAPSSGETSVRSSTFAELWPPFPDRETSMLVEQPVLRDRLGSPFRDQGEVTVLEAPTASNDFTLILEFRVFAGSFGRGIPVRIIVEPAE